MQRYAEQLVLFSCSQDKEKEKSADVDVDAVNGNGHVNGNGVKGGVVRYEVNLPVAGTDTVAKMRDKNSVESNKMFAFKSKEI